MIQTLANGEKIKKILEPDDPILTQYAITAKKSYSTSSLPKANEKPAATKDIRQRIGAKIGSEIKGTLRSDRDSREPQRSVKSRLSSPKYSNLRVTASSSSTQEPKARKRITAPNDYEDEPDRKYAAVSSASGDSSSIKSRLGTRQRISF